MIEDNGKKLYKIEELSDEARKVAMSIIAKEISDDRMEKFKRGANMYLDLFGEITNSELSHVHLDKNSSGYDFKIYDDYGDLKGKELKNLLIDEGIIDKLQKWIRDKWYDEMLKPIVEFDFKNNITYRELIDKCYEDYVDALFEEYQYSISDKYVDLTFSTDPRYFGRLFYENGTAFNIFEF